MRTPAALANQFDKVMHPDAFFYGQGDVVQEAHVTSPVICDGGIYTEGEQVVQEIGKGPSTAPVIIYEGEISMDTTFADQFVIDASVLNDSQFAGLDLNNFTAANVGDEEVPATTISTTCENPQGVVLDLSMNPGTSDMMPIVQTEDVPVVGDEVNIAVTPEGGKGQPMVPNVDVPVAQGNSPKKFVDEYLAFIVTSPIKGPAGDQDESDDEDPEQNSSGLEEESGSEGEGEGPDSKENDDSAGNNEDGSDSGNTPGSGSGDDDDEDGKDGEEEEEEEEDEEEHEDEDDDTDTPTDYDDRLQDIGDGNGLETDEDGEYEPPSDWQNPGFLFTEEKEEHMKGRKISDYHYNVLLGKLHVDRPPRAQQNTEKVQLLLKGETVELREGLFMELWNGEVVDDSDDEDLVEAHYSEVRKDGQMFKFRMLRPLNTPCENDIRKMKFDINIKEEDLNLGKSNAAWLFRPELRKIKRIPLDFKDAPIEVVMSEIKTAAEALDTAMKHGRKLDEENRQHAHIYHDAKDKAWDSFCGGIKIPDDADFFWDDEEHFGKFGDTLPAFEDVKHLDNFTIVVITRESPGLSSKSWLATHLGNGLFVNSVKLQECFEDYGSVHALESQKRYDKPVHDKAQRKLVRSIRELIWPSGSWRTMVSGVRGQKRAPFHEQRLKLAQELCDHMNSTWTLLREKNAKGSGDIQFLITQQAIRDKERFKTRLHSFLDVPFKPCFTPTVDENGKPTDEDQTSGDDEEPVVIKKKVLKKTRQKKKAQLVEETDDEDEDFEVVAHIGPTRKSPRSGPGQSGKPIDEEETSEDDSEPVVIKKRKGLRKTRSKEKAQLVEKSDGELEDTVGLDFEVVDHVDAAPTRKSSRLECATSTKKTGEKNQDPLHVSDDDEIAVQQGSLHVAKKSSSGKMAKGSAGVSKKGDKGSTGSSQIGSKKKKTMKRINEDFFDNDDDDDFVDPPMTKKSSNKKKDDEKGGNSTGGAKAHNKGEGKKNDQGKKRAEEETKKGSKKMGTVKKDAPPMKQAPEPVQADQPGTSAMKNPEGRGRRTLAFKGDQPQQGKNDGKSPVKSTLSFVGFGPATNILATISSQAKVAPKKMIPEQGNALGKRALKDNEKETTEGPKNKKQKNLNSTSKRT